MPVHLNNARDPATLEGTPDDWRWQLRNAVTDAEGLSRALHLTPREALGAKRAEEAGLPMSITPYYLALCDRDDPGCPVRLQCVPDAREAARAEGDLEDPLGEVAHEVAPHLVQRYPDRALLLATDHRIQSTVLSQIDEIDGELFQRFQLLLASL